MQGIDSLKIIMKDTQHLNTKKSVAENIQWIDVLKGIGIITVVIGHLWPSNQTGFIYLFHMPLFFFIAGFLFRPTSNYKGYLIKKSIHLLLPYVSFLFLLIFPLALPSLIKDHHMILPFIKSLIFGGRYLQGVAAVFWFVTCFFATQQIFNFLHTKLSTFKFVATISLLLILGYLNSEYYPQWWLPWNLNVVLFTIPIFSLGYLFKALNKNLPFSILVGFILISFLTVYFFNDSYSLDLKSSNYGVPILSLISSVTIIISLVGLSKKITNFPLASKFLISVGQASMTIMYLHNGIRNRLWNVIPNHNLYLIFFFTVLIAYVLNLVLSRFKLSRAFLLGSDKDLYTIFPGFTPDPVTNKTINSTKSLVL
jgi:fucose 4-O-acetylase-like acetyltransferase